MARYATIDIGTNSLKMNVVEVSGGQVRVLADLTDVTSLGKVLHETGSIGEEEMVRNVDDIAGYVERCRELKVDQLAAVGTMALRNAKDTPEFVHRVADRCGVDLEVIPGEEEARLSYLAILSGLTSLEGRVCIFDTGGGSTTSAAARLECAATDQAMASAKITGRNSRTIALPLSENTSNTGCARS